MRTFIGGGGRREINIQCPSCGHPSQIPPSAVARNQFFCSGCGKSMDLSQVFRQVSPEGTTAAPLPRRDRTESKYKSARKGRR